jgi:hypothetical protein
MSDATIEIPDSVMKLAFAIVDANPHHRDTTPILIASAIMTERERCAEVAEALETVIPMWDRPGGPPGNGPARAGTPKEIAAAIRRGET